MLEDGAVISAIIEKRKALSLQHALLIGISGIDAAGKGFVTARIAESLQERGPRVGSDQRGWLAKSPACPLSSAGFGKALLRKRNSIR
jgi:hypothetical protein